MVAATTGYMRERQYISPRTVTGVLATSVLVLTMAACGDDEDAAPAATTVAAAESSAAESSAAESSAADSASAMPAEGGVTVMDAWSRMPAAGQATSAVYGTVMNGTDADVTIVSATTSVTENVQLHETIMGDDGTMTMQEKEGGFVVPAGGQFVFESGGPHIMLFDVDAATYPASVDVTLTLDSGETVAFTAEVRAVDATEEMSGMEMSGTAEATHEEDDHTGAAETLHDVDEQLAEGMLDPSQLVVVQSEIDALGEPEAGTPEAEYLAVLEQLMTALEAGDAEAAAPLATQAHDVGHELEEHNG